MTISKRKGPLRKQIELEPFQKETEPLWSHQQLYKTDMNQNTKKENAKQGKPVNPKSQKQDKPR